MRLRVDLAYDGAPFHGFARQSGDLKTVQGVVEEALSRVLRQDVTTIGAARTDKGVHAHAQVIHADVDPAPAQAQLADLDGLGRRLDRMSGPAIKVYSVQSVTDAFDARFSARYRQYLYRVAVGPEDPLLRGLVWYLDADLHVPSMRAAAKSLLGQHDFAAFCRKSRRTTSERRLDRVAVQRVKGLMSIRLRGPAFCHQQVRSIVACLVEVGASRRPIEWVAEVLAARDRSRAVRLAPPHALLLERIGYGAGVPAAGMTRALLAASPGTSTDRPTIRRR